MDLIIRFLESTAWKMTPPVPYHAFHLIFWIVGLFLSIFIAFMLRRIGDKADRWLIFGIGLFLLISEIYKQLFYTYIIGAGSYQYERIPFQLCSIPMYLCLILPWLKKGKLKQTLATFIASFGFMGGFVSYFSPESMCLSYWMLTLHSFTWHMILVFLGLYFYFSGRAGKSFRDFYPAAWLYLSLCAVAFSINLMCYDIPGANVNLFSLGPKPTGIIICRDIVRVLGWEVNAVLYMITLIACAGLFYLVYLYVYKRFTERVRSLKNAEESMPGLYEEILTHCKDLKRNAIYFYGRHISYARMFDSIDRAARALIGLGIKPGDTVTLALPNMPLAPYLFYGANKIGATVNLVHPLEPYEKLKTYVKQTESRAVFVFDELADRYADRWESLKCPVVFCSVTDNITDFESVFYRMAKGGKRKNIRRILKSKPSGLMEYPDFLALGNAEPVFAGQWDHVAAIMHSGGVTGEPKSILLSDRAISTAGHAIVCAIAGETDRGGDEKLLAVLPMFHAFGLGVGFHCAFLHGFESVLVPRYSPKTIVRYIARKKITVIAGVPTMYKGILKEARFDCPQVRYLTAAFCGGDRLDDGVRQSFDEIVRKHGGTCRLYEGYGITEACGVYCANRRGEAREGTVGKPLREDYLAETFVGAVRQPRGAVGEICLSSPSLMSGYLNGRENPLFEAEGKIWLKTGDRGSVDRDGFVRFCEREKRIVKVSGVNVFPSEVEAVIARDPSVEIVGVKAAEDERKGHVLIAYIQLKQGADADEALSRLRALCAERLNKWSQPKRYLFRDKIALTPLGKVDYKQLKEE